MEGSKMFAKDFMARHEIPTARYENFSDYKTAKAHLDAVSYDVVIKANGVAGGKGVLLPSTKEEAHAGLEKLMLRKEFGSAGEEVVIEEYLDGYELSFLSFSDGYTIRSMPPAQDHKQIFDNDKGPNTGGMGCYAPAPMVTPDLIGEVHRTILQPTVDWMRKEGSHCRKQPIA
jgi:phosphoribosylamine--glycine ligase/phosphoribosylformylglycinamidine cyclo-ligase